MAKVNIEAKVFKQIQLNSTIKMVELIAPEIANQAEPGQFVNVRVSKQTAPLLRRPLGIADINIPRGSITLMYRILGEATNILADMQSGDKVGILGPLGNGFDIKAQKPLIVGGGLGLAPLLSLAKFGFGNGRTDVLIAGRNEEE
ncbi:MAG: dihydroorotate dehydrogenase electron transfer subunit, partial [Phascolarctobacterium sp.]|nr:dihydroorotate dehydrogenase electron transfer subunit [Candidatus Phascolarctobacterium caballi]